MPTNPHRCEPNHAGKNCKITRPPTRSEKGGDKAGQDQSHARTHAEGCGDKHADAKRPQQFGPENSPLVNFGWIVLGMGVAIVVLRPGPMAMASEPSAMASAANPAASRASLPRCIRTAATA